jgi:hypothetical protein
MRRYALDRHEAGRKRLREWQMAEKPQEVTLHTAHA